MNFKPRSTTQGVPMILGIVAAVLLLIQLIMQGGWSMTSAEVQDYSFTVGTIVGKIFGYAIYPGIFLILLLAGLKTPQRTKSFGVVWIVFSSLSILGNLGSISIYGNTELMSFIDIASVPDTVIAASYVSILGSAFMLASCITFLNKLSREAANMPPFQPPYQPPFQPPYQQ